MYGTQTLDHVVSPVLLFENDVKMYGTQTIRRLKAMRAEFENDVKMYGTQTYQGGWCYVNRLRMM